MPTQPSQDAQPGRPTTGSIVLATAVGAVLGGLLGMLIGATSGPPRPLAAGDRVWLNSFTLYPDELGQRSFVESGQYVTLLRPSQQLSDRWLVRTQNGSEGWADVPAGLARTY